MKDYTSMDRPLAITLEVEWVLTKLGEIPFELLKEEQEEGAVVDVVEKQINALNGFVINFFKQGVASNRGVGSPRTSISFVC